MLALAANPARPQSRMAWPGGRRAAVSLTYDDGLDSQIDRVAPQLEAMGLKGTFFLTRDNVQERIADWRAVHARGHEIGNHSITHPCKLRRLSGPAFGRDEIEAMELFLGDNFGEARFRSYAYPCGFIALGEGSLSRRVARYETVLRGTIAAARTVDGPPNDPRDVRDNRFWLHATEPTYDRDDPRRAFRYVREAQASGGWAILVFHDVLGSRKGEGDTSSATHQTILQWLAEEPVWCAPFGEVFQHIVRQEDTGRLLARR